MVNVNVINAECTGSLQDVSGPGGVHRPSRASISGPPGRRNSSFVHNTSFVRNSSLGRFDANQADDVFDKSSRITLNIAGLRFDVPLSVLTKYPDTLLGNPMRFRRHYDHNKDEYYFSRDRTCFEAIWQYYQTGQLRRPPNARLDTFVQEARFFDLGQEALLQFSEDEGFIAQPAALLPRHPLQRHLWQVVELPHSSVAAKCFAIFSTLIIVFSIFVFCIETLPQFREAPARQDNDTGWEAVTVSRGYGQFQQPLFVAETLCIAWFTLEFILRALTCPNKKTFFRNPIEVIDVLAIVPYYIDLVIVLIALRRGQGAVREGGVLMVLRIVRLVRVFRIFKLSRYSRGLQMLGLTFWMAIRELGLLLLFLAIGVVLFSSAVYYAEQGSEHTGLTSIPEAFWWAIVTMTTVGYGDVAPKTVMGKVVGSACAISGLIVVALPVPIIVSKFNAVYQREKDRVLIEEILADILRPHDVPVVKKRIHKPASNGRIAEFHIEIEPILEEK